MFAGINEAGVFVAALAAFALGALWYQPFTFGKAWMAALGKSADELGSPGPGMLVSAVGCLVVAFVVETLRAGLDIETLTEGAVLGAMIGIGIDALLMASEYTFSSYPRMLYLINAGYRAALVTLVGAILGAWA